MKRQLSGEGIIKSEVGNTFPDSFQGLPDTDTEKRFTNRQSIHSCQCGVVPSDSDSDPGILVLGCLVPKCTAL